MFYPDFYCMLGTLLWNMQRTDTSLTLLHAVAAVTAKVLLPPPSSPGSRELLVVSAVSLQLFGLNYS